jgi:tRNA (guanine-N7-)-methyltransferase
MMNKNGENGSDHRQRAAGAFYGRRKTRPLKHSQALLFKELLPRLALDLSKPAPSDLGELIVGKPGRIILEIGFGGGEHLIQRAQEQPRDGFIGCEPFINGMGKALSAIEKQQLANIRLYDRDATELLDWLPANSVDVVYLLYPDPWPKKRHWKRRFVSVGNLERIARILKPEGEFRFASDIAHYVNWTLVFCHNCDGLEWQAESCYDWINPWQAWKSTRYELKAIREGRTPIYLTFKRR